MEDKEDGIKLKQTAKIEVYTMHGHCLIGNLACSLTPLRLISHSSLQNSCQAPRREISVAES